MNRRSAERVSRRRMLFGRRAGAWLLAAFLPIAAGPGMADRADAAVAATHASTTGHVLQQRPGRGFVPVDGIVRGATFPAGPAHLTYYGGPVIPNISVVQVIYGAPGSYLPETLATGYPSVGSFVSSVLSSPHIDWLNEYNTTGGQKIGRGRFGDKYTVTPDPSRNGPKIFDSQVQAELIHQLDLGTLPPPALDATGQVTSMYSLFFRHGQQICDDNSMGQPCSLVSLGFCAYHGALLYKSRMVPYSVSPDLVGQTRCGGAANSDYQRTTVVLAHEVVETITNPFGAFASALASPLAWYDQATSGQGEIGDICNGLSDNILGADGHSYRTQLEWSNTANNCIVSRTETNDFAVSVPTPAVAAVPGTQVTTTVSVPLTAGAPGPVALAVTGLGAGVTGAFGPPSVSPGSTATSTLTLTIGPSAAPGTRLFVVTGTAGAVVHSAMGALTLTSGGPPPPGSALDTSSPVGRIADTRSGPPLGPGAVLRVRPAGTGLSAAVLNVTEVSATAPGYLAVWPCDDAQPGSSALNFGPGRVVPNLVSVAVGAGGEVCIFNSGGQTNVAVDQMATYVPAATVGPGRLIPIAPVRALDTRQPGASAFGAGEVRTVDLKPFGVPADARAVALTVTVASAPTVGYWTVWPSGSAPGSSNLNVDHAGQTVANQVVVASSAGAVQVLGSAGGHLLIDVTGYFTGAPTPLSATGLYHPMTPVRAADTRGGPKPTDEVVDLSPWIPLTATAVTLNTTVTEPDGPGYLTVYPAGAGIPNASNVNFSAGLTIADHVVTGSPNAHLAFHSPVPTHMIADLSGWFG